MTYIVGLDAPFPKKEDYSSFLERLETNIGRYDSLKGLFALCYGSVSRGGHVAGSSDLDFFFSFPHTVTKKPALRDLGKALEQTTRPWFGQEKTYIHYEYTIADEETMRDGRFNSFDPTFKEYFANEGLVIHGTPTFDSYNYLLPTKNAQQMLTKDLVKLRGTIVDRPFLEKHDPHAAIHSFDKAITKSTTAIKRMAIMESNALFIDRFSTQKMIEENSGTTGQNTYDELRSLHSNPESRLLVYQSPERMNELLCSSLTLVEELMSSHIKKIPRDE